MDDELDESGENPVIMNQLINEGYLFPLGTLVSSCCERGDENYIITGYHSHGYEKYPPWSENDIVVCFANPEGDEDMEMWSYFKHHAKVISKPT